MSPGAKLFILINLYKDNHYSLRWQTELKVPVQALSEAEYKRCCKNMVSKCGGAAHP